LVLALVNAQPPDADTVAYAFWMAALTALTVLSEMMALGLGVVGASAAAQEDVRVPGHSMRGVRVSGDPGLGGAGDLASGVVAFFTEPPPKVHIVSPKNE
jgi:hypothetical protein